jgi:GTP-binding protein
MLRLPKIAIVGRPNVGKSALFNRICKKRIAIVDEAEGITRDRLYAEGDCFGRSFELIDTGGIDPHSDAPFNEQVKWQAEIAIEEADSLIMVVDGMLGMTDLDLEVARILQRTGKPVCVAVNKVDNIQQEIQVHEFHALGLPAMVPVSAIQGLHLAELLELALRDVPEDLEGEESAKGIKVAIIGRPNVGKSTLINHILDEERCIASPIAGTTRDSIDVIVERGDETYTFIDTAGIRRKTAEHEVVDKFAAIRTERAIARADICLLLVDAQQGITTQEKRIARDIEEAGKGCIVLLNKWDLVQHCRMEHATKQSQEEVPFLRHCPMLCLSALSGRNVEEIFQLIQLVRREQTKRISTGQLNRLMEKAIQLNHPPRITGKRLRIYYLTQVGEHPPRFVLFVNNPKLMPESYRKYLLNQLRNSHKFTGSPVVFYLKGKEQQRRHEKKQMEKDLEESGQELVFFEDLETQEEDAWLSSESELEPV